MTSAAKSVNTSMESIDSVESRADEEEIDEAARTFATIQGSRPVVPMHSAVDDDDSSISLSDDDDLLLDREDSVSESDDASLTSSSEDSVSGLEKPPKRSATLKKHLPEVSQIAPLGPRSVVVFQGFTCACDYCVGVKRVEKRLSGGGKRTSKLPLVLFRRWKDALEECFIQMQHMFPRSRWFHLSSLRKYLELHWDRLWSSDRQAQSSKSPKDASQSTHVVNTLRSHCPETFLSAGYKSGLWSLRSAFSESELAHVPMDDAHSRSGPDKKEDEVINAPMTPEQIAQCAVLAKQLVTGASAHELILLLMHFHRVRRVKNSSDRLRRSSGVWPLVLLSVDELRTRANEELDLLSAASQGVNVVTPYGDVTLCVCCKAPLGCFSTTKRTKEDVPSRAVSSSCEYGLCAPCCEKAQSEVTRACKAHAPPKPGSAAAAAAAKTKASSKPSTDSTSSAASDTSKNKVPGKPGNAVNHDDALTDSGPAGDLPASSAGNDASTDRPSGDNGDRAGTNDSGSAGQANLDFVGDAGSGDDDSGDNSKLQKPGKKERTRNYGEWSFVEREAFFAGLLDWHKSSIESREPPPENLTHPDIAPCGVACNPNAFLADIHPIVEEACYDTVESQVPKPSKKVAQPDSSTVADETGGKSRRGRGGNQKPGDGKLEGTLVDIEGTALGKIRRGALRSEPGVVAKTREQVRQYFYRCVKRVKALLALVNDENGETKSEAKDAKEPIFEAEMLPMLLLFWRLSRPHELMTAIGEVRRRRQLFSAAVMTAAKKRLADAADASAIAEELAASARGSAKKPASSRSIEHVIAEATKAARAMAENRPKDNDKDNDAEIIIGIASLLKAALENWRSLLSLEMQHGTRPTHHGATVSVDTSSASSGNASTSFAVAELPSSGDGGKSKTSKERGRKRKAEKKAKVGKRAKKQKRVSKKGGSRRSDDPLEALLAAGAPELPAAASGNATAQDLRGINTLLDAARDMSNPDFTRKRASSSPWGPAPADSQPAMKRARVTPSVLMLYAPLVHEDPLQFKRKFGCVRMTSRFSAQVDLAIGDVVDVLEKHGDSHVRGNRGVVLWFTNSQQGAIAHIRLVVTKAESEAAAARPTQKSNSLLDDLAELAINAASAPGFEREVLDTSEEEEEDPELELIQDEEIDSPPKFRTFGSHLRTNDPDGEGRPAQELDWVPNGIRHVADLTTRQAFDRVESAVPAALAAAAELDGTPAEQAPLVLGTEVGECNVKWLTRITSARHFLGLSSEYR